MHKKAHNNTIVCRNIQSREIPRSEERSSPSEERVAGLDRREMELDKRKKELDRREKNWIEERHKR